MTEPTTCYRHPNRETGLSCTECGRPICVDCATFAPVGIKCPEHSGVPRGAARVTRTVRRQVRVPGGDPIVTKALVAINVIVYLAELAQGAGVNANSGSIFANGALYGPLVAHGDWWRLMSAAFLHYGPIHLGMNMLALWWLGGPVELALGRGRFLLLYLASGLAGSAGALLLTPLSPTVGASGAIFGILGAGLILEWRATGRFAGQYLMLILVNLAFTFTISSISKGGHLGGLVGGALGTLALVHFSRVRSLPGRLNLGIAGVVAIGAASVAIAYFKVRGYA